MTNDITNKCPVKNCINSCRWCFLIPLAFGIICFLFGYFQPAQYTALLWQAGSIVIIFASLSCVTMLKTHRWRFLIPLIFGIICFGAGYYQDASLTRILWLAGSILIIFLGLSSFIFSLSQRDA